MNVDKIDEKKSEAPREYVSTRRSVHYQNLDDISSGQLSWFIKLSYCAPTMSTLPIVLFLSVYVTQFYEKLGASLSYISFFIALARSFDVISDPLMSYATDSLRSRYGRRRPFLFVGCWLYSFFLILLMSPPLELNQTQLSLWFGVFYVIFFLCSTFTNIPYDALGPELTDNYLDRSKLYFVSGLFDGFGSLLSVLLPVALAQYLMRSSKCAEPMNFCVNKDSFGSSCYPFIYKGIYQRKTYNTSSLNIDTLNSTHCKSFVQTKSINTGRGCFPGMECFCECVSSCQSQCVLNNERTAYRLVTLGFGIWYCIFMMNCVLCIKERCQKTTPPHLKELHNTAHGTSKSEMSAIDNQSTIDQKKVQRKEFDKSPPLVPSLLQTFDNYPFVCLLPAWVCDAVVNAIIASMMAYFVRYVVQPEYSPQCLEDPDSDSNWLCNSQSVLGASITCLLLVAFLSTPMWLKINRTIGKRNAWLLWSFSMAATNIIYIFLGKGDMKLCIIVTGINGLPFGAKFIADAILADIIDYDELLTGQRSEATYTMFKSFLPKICAVPASAIPIAVLNSIGHIPPNSGIVQQQPRIVFVYVKIVTVIIPTVLSLLGYWLKCKYPLKTKEQVDEIAKGVGKHILQESAIDPISGKEIKCHNLIQKDQEELYLLAYFPSIHILKILLDCPKKGAQVLCTKMKLQMASYICLLFCCITLSIATFGLIENNSWSTIPVVCIIGVGVLLTGSIFSISRYFAARHLKNNIPSEANIRLSLAKRMSLQCQISGDKYQIHPDVTSCSK